MSRYQEMTDKAVDYSKRFLVYRDDCMFIAKNIAHQFMIFLNAPQDSIQFIDLNINCEFTEILKYMSDLPNITLGDDGYYYFGLSLICKSNQEYIMQQKLILGIQKQDKQLSVKWNGKTFLSPSNDISGLDKLFLKLVENSIEFYSSPIVNYRNNIGYISSKI